MSSSLASVPIAARRRVGLAVGLFAALLAAVGVVALTGARIATTVLGIVALAVAGTLGLIAWGVARSVQLDLSERELDAAIEAAVAAHGMSCDCGQEHDPTELRITDECDHDGQGEICSHDCDSCALAALRPGFPR